MILSMYVYYYKKHAKRNILLNWYIFLIINYNWESGLYNKKNIDRLESTLLLC